MKKQKQPIKPQIKVKIESIGTITPHNEALFEMGKEMLKSSLITSREFCKFMITVSTGSIPIYLALLAFVIPENTSLPIETTILSVIPPFMFLISALVFIFGYFPKVDSFSLDIIDEIKQAYEDTFKIRKNLTFLGTIFYFIGVIIVLIAILIQIFGW